MANFTILIISIYIYIYIYIYGNIHIYNTYVRTKQINSKNTNLFVDLPILKYILILSMDLQQPCLNIYIYLYVCVSMCADCKLHISRHSRKLAIFNLFKMVLQFELFIAILFAAIKNISHYLKQSTTQFDYQYIPSLFKLSYLFIILISSRVCIQ